MTSVARYNKLDYLKGLACCGVVFIHVKFPGVFGQIMTTLSSCAVPIFFMISGFFAYRVDGIRNEQIKNQVLKLPTLFSVLNLEKSIL